MSQLAAAVASIPRGQIVKTAPPLLVHGENLEFLTGLRSFGASRFTESFEHVLRNWANSDGDYLALANGTDGWLTAPSIHVLLEQSEDGRSYACHSRNTETDEMYTLPGGPKCVITIHKNRGVEDSVSDKDRLATIAIPLQPLLSTAADIVGRHVVYAHTLTLPNSQKHQGAGSKTGLTYIGITRRGWAARWGEHRHGANTNSPYRFHDALRRHPDAMRTHQVIACGIGFDEAMETEERFVEALSLYPNGLNMIPGGHAGLRYLAQHGFHADRKGWEHRERIIRQFGNCCSRAGKPNPLAAARWQDDSYAVSVICANPNNFTLEQVLEARYFESLGWGTSALASRYECSEERVGRLLRGETYSRVH